MKILKKKIWWRISTFKHLLLLAVTPSPACSRIPVTIRAVTIPAVQHTRIIARWLGSCRRDLRSAGTANSIGGRSDHLHGPLGSFSSPCVTYHPTLLILQTQHATFCRPPTIPTIPTDFEQLLCRGYGYLEHSPPFALLYPLCLRPAKKYDHVLSSTSTSRFTFEPWPNRRCHDMVPPGRNCLRCHCSCRYQIGHIQTLH